MPQFAEAPKPDPNKPSFPKADKGCTGLCFQIDSGKPGACKVKSLKGTSYGCTIIYYIIDADKICSTFKDGFSKLKPGAPFRIDSCNTSDPGTTCGCKSSTKYTKAPSITLVLNGEFDASDFVDKSLTTPYNQAKGCKLKIDATIELLDVTGYIGKCCASKAGAAPMPGGK